MRGIDIVMKDAAKNMYKRNRMQVIRRAVPRGIQAVIEKRKDRIVKKWEEEVNKDKVIEQLKKSQTKTAKKAMQLQQLENPLMMTKPKKTREG